MRVAVLGVGAMGGAIVGSLSDTDVDLLCVARRGMAAQLERGLTVFTPEGAVEMIPKGRYELIDSEAGPIPKEIRGSCEVAIITGKASSTESLSSIAHEVLTKDGIAISIQNGLDHVQKMGKIVGPERSIGGSTTHSAWKDNEFSIHWTGRGDIEIGRMDGSPPNGISSELIMKLEEAGLNPKWSNDIERVIWRKLMINVAINPICAIAGIRNGALKEIPELWSQSIESMKEAEAVALASGVDLSDLDSEDYLIKIVDSTSENRVSMLQDLMAGRKTEVDELCGAVSNRGSKLGIPTPRNDMLLALVRGIECSRNFD